MHFSQQCDHHSTVDLWCDSMCERSCVHAVILFAIVVLRIVEPGHCTFLSNGSRFMYNNWIVHSKSTRLKPHDFLLQIFVSEFNHDLVFSR